MSSEEKGGAEDYHGTLQTPSTPARSEAGMNMSLTPGCDSENDPIGVTFVILPSKSFAATVSNSDMIDGEGDGALDLGAFGADESNDTWTAFQQHFPTLCRTTSAQTVSPVGMHGQHAHVESANQRKPVGGSTKLTYAESVDRPHGFGHVYVTATFLRTHESCTKRHMDDLAREGFLSSHYADPAHTTNDTHTLSGTRGRTWLHRITSGSSPLYFGQDVCAKR
jgi:hypothetical protein